MGYFSVEHFRRTSARWRCGKISKWRGKQAPETCNICSGVGDEWILGAALILRSVRARDRRPGGSVYDRHRPSRRTSVTVIDRRGWHPTTSTTSGVLLLHVVSSFVRWPRCRPWLHQRHTATWPPFRELRRISTVRLRRSSTRIATSTQSLQLDVYFCAFTSSIYTTLLLCALHSMTCFLLLLQRWSTCVAENRCEQWRI